MCGRGSAFWSVVPWLQLPESSTCEASGELMTSGRLPSTSPESTDAPPQPQESERLPQHTKLLPSGQLVPLLKTLRPCLLPLTLAASATHSGCSTPMRAVDQPRVSLPLVEAPATQPWPAGLPDPTTNDDGSELLPKELADAVHAVVLGYPLLGKRCRQAVREQHNLGLVSLDAAWRQCDARVDEARVQGRIEAGSQWASWEVALLAGGVGVGAVAVGLLVGLVSGGADTIVVK